LVAAVLITAAGGQEFRFPGAVVVSANITPDPQTGIGRGGPFSARGFSTFLR